MNVIPQIARCLLALLPTALAAQTIAGEFAPNPASPGTPITLTCTDAFGQGLQLSSPCGWHTIHQGSQTGPIIHLGIFCQQVIVPVPANGTFSFTWDQRDATGQFVPPGVYWIEARAWDPNFTTLASDWFCISIQPAGVPALTASGPARLGLITPLAIAAPSEAGSLYVAAVSLSANTPIQIPGLDICLSDPIFLAPLTVPVGVLDGSGNSNGLELIVPGAAIALWQGLHVQAVLFGPNGLRVTNDLSFTIQP